MFQNGSKNQYLGFQQISGKSVKVKFLTYHVTRPHMELKLAFIHFQNMLELSQYGPGLFNIDASSDPSKFWDDWLCKSRLNVEFQNKKLAKMANLTNEKGEFAVAIFRRCPLPPAGSN